MFCCANAARTEAESRAGLPQFYRTPSVGGMMMTEIALGYVNFEHPTPEDIAAGLSEEQCSAILEMRDDKPRRHSVSLQRPVPKWRPALMERRNGRLMLTEMGSNVRVILAEQHR
jgi:hypothetical protein